MRCSIRARELVGRPVERERSSRARAARRSTGDPRPAADSRRCARARARGPRAFGRSGARPPPPQGRAARAPACAAAGPARRTAPRRPRVRPARRAGAARARRARRAGRARCRPRRSAGGPLPARRRSRHARARRTRRPSRRGRAARRRRAGARPARAPPPSAAPSGSAGPHTAPSRRTRPPRQAAVSFGERDRRRRLARGRRAEQGDDRVHLRQAGVRTGADARSVIDVAASTRTVWNEPGSAGPGKITVLFVRGSCRARASDPCATAPRRAPRPRSRSAPGCAHRRSPARARPAAPSARA